MTGEFSADRFADRFTTLLVAASNRLSHDRQAKTADMPQLNTGQEPLAPSSTVK